MKFFVLFTISLGLTLSLAKAQSGDLIAHWEIAVPISYKINDHWRMNTTLTGRNGFYDREGGDEGTRFFSNFIEVTQFVSRRINQRLSVSVGYRYREREPFEGVDLYEHRLIEQVGYVHFRTATRLASRLRAEQRWRNELFSNRVRYRLSVDRPFSGEKLDAGEYYFIFSDELVAEFPGRGDNTLENRIAAGLGRLWNKQFKVQLDLQLRSDDIFGATEQEVFVLTSFYIQLK